VTDRAGGGGKGGISASKTSPERTQSSASGRAHQGTREQRRALIAAGLIAQKPITTIAREVGFRESGPPKRRTPRQPRLSSVAGWSPTIRQFSV
jgi:hypothetical protein